MSFFPTRSSYKTCKKYCFELFRGSGTQCIDAAKTRTTIWEISTQKQQKEHLLSEELKAMHKICTDQMNLEHAQSQWFSDETSKFPKNLTIWILGWAMAPPAPPATTPLELRHDHKQFELIIVEICNSSVNSQLRLPIHKLNF